MFFLEEARDHATAPFIALTPYQTIDKSRDDKSVVPDRAGTPSDGPVPFRDLFDATNTIVHGQLRPDRILRYVPICSHALFYSTPIELGGLGF